MPLVAVVFAFFEAVVRVVEAAATTSEEVTTGERGGCIPVFVAARCFVGITHRRPRPREVSRLCWRRCKCASDVNGCKGLRQFGRVLRSLCVASESFCFWGDPWARIAARIALAGSRERTDSVG